MSSKPTSIELSAKDRTVLREIVSDGNTRQKIAKRARIVLMTAEGHGTVAIMRAVGPPLKKGRAGTMTHDYKRNGTITLFAALNVATGEVIGECLPRHRATEFLTFLKTIDRQTPSDLDLHLTLDNYATHKAPPVKRWLKHHPRVTLHFTPTSSSWLNLVERPFAEITRQRIRRGTFTGVPQLEAAITDWIESQVLRLDRQANCHHRQVSARPRCSR
jgi:transposase